MTFSYNITKETVLADKRLLIGNFTNSDGSTGGVIDGRMHIIEAVLITYTGSSIITSSPVVNGTFPIDKLVTIVTAADTSGIFIIIGH